MEKLIELLNEYEKKNVVHRYEWSGEDVLVCRYIGDNFVYYTDEATTIAISKYYGFIQRLVENDKIDKEKIIREETLPLVDVNEKYLLMMLAIQDEPIDVLVSILK